MEDQCYNLKIILLAAGKSERFNGIKLLAKVQQQKDSITLIEHTLQQISVALSKLNIHKSNLRIATGRYHSKITKSLDEHEKYFFDYCDDAHLGLGHTIAQSVKQMLANPQQDDRIPSHIMIALADQVALTSDDYIELIKQSLVSPNKLICAKAGQEIMPPAIFPAAFFKDLRQLKGDKGAKTILFANRENLEAINITHAERDIDTRLDLTNWYNNK